ncbi:MAG: BRCT domain-containing protein [Thermoanaerobaculia bacterium]
MSIIHPDHESYIRFTGPARVDKAINSLLGIVEGITADSVINDAELTVLSDWLLDHEPYQGRHPFDELLPVMKNALADGVLAEDERDDIVWLCERLRSTDYHDRITADVQRLHAVVAGIAADGVITTDELRSLQSWIEDHEALRTCYPYDEVDTLVTATLADGKIDRREHDLLLHFFSEFVDFAGHRTVERPLMADGAVIRGVCAACPTITFTNSVFCFTGASSRYTRQELVRVVTAHGGAFTARLRQDVNYLVIGADGNPCWAYACYGRKVEEAIALRKRGFPLLLVHENDFHDAVADAGLR